MRITNGGYVLEENKDSSSKTIIQFIVSGEQVNISTDNGTVNANQNNETKMVEKQIIIENKSKNYNQNPNGKSGESDDGTRVIGTNLCNGFVCTISLADFTGGCCYILVDRVINLYDIL